MFARHAFFVGTESTTFIRIDLGVLAGTTVAVFL